MRPDRTVNQLFYSAPASHPIGHASDLDILKVARERNAQAGITGYLFRDRTSFYQLLEGSAEALDTLLVSIARDPRCGTIEMWMRRDAERRTMAGWSMGYSQLRGKTADLLCGYRFGEDWSGLLPTLKSLAAAA